MVIDTRYSGFLHKKFDNSSSSTPVLAWFDPCRLFKICQTQVLPQETKTCFEKLKQKSPKDCIRKQKQKSPSRQKKNCVLSISRLARNIFQNKNNTSYSRFGQYHSKRNREIRENFRFPAKHFQLSTSQAIWFLKYLCDALQSNCIELRRKRCQTCRNAKSS